SSSLRLCQSTAKLSPGAILGAEFLGELLRQVSDRVEALPHAVIDEAPGPRRVEIDGRRRATTRSPNTADTRPGDDTATSSKIRGKRDRYPALEKMIGPGNHAGGDATLDNDQLRIMPVAPNLDEVRALEVLVE